MTQCPYCTRVPLNGPAIAAGDATPFDVVLDHAPESVLIPTVGTLIPGYLLLVTRSHIQSYGGLPETALVEIDGYFARLLPKLDVLFGEYFVFEHGMGSAVTHGQGGCIDHAHLHLIPARTMSEKSIRRALAWRRIDALARLSEFRAEGYALYGRPGFWCAVLSPCLPSQWVRQVVAAGLGTAHWDWAIETGIANLALTLNRIRDAGSDLFSP